MAVNKNVKYSFWENTTKKTIVISSAHPNRNLYLYSGYVSKLTEEEVTEYNVAKLDGVSQVTADSAKAKKALRPKDIRDGMINKRFAPPPAEKLEDEEKESKKDPGGFNHKPRTLDAITKEPIVKEKQKILDMTTKQPIQDLATVNAS